MLTVSCTVSSLLLGSGLFLILLFPLWVGHAVHVRTCIFIRYVHVTFAGSGYVIFGYAVTTESCQIHQIDVLNVRALLQMGNQSTEGCSFKFGLGLLVQRFNSGHTGF